MEPVIFGSSFQQSATTFTVSKADLSSFGLVASATNKQEELLAALILKWKNDLTQAAWSVNANANVFVTEEQPTLNSRTIGTDTKSFYTYQFQISIATESTLNPSQM